MSRDDIEGMCPNLRTSVYRVTSEATPHYNCTAWAAGDTSRWWQPIGDEQFYHWPTDVPRDLSPVSYVRLFELQGYEVCDSSDMELGFEKVAIYVQDDEFSHVARQVETGLWTSKLGELEDIEHATLADLEGDYYGTVSHILRRRRQAVGR
jgi:hypothetical protein